MLRIPRKPAVGNGQMLFQNALHPVAETKIDISDDRLADAGCAISAAPAHRGNSTGKLGLAERFQILLAFRAVHGAALDEDASNDIVTGLKIRQHLVQQIARLRCIPEVMMRIDDGELRIERRLHMLVEPRLVHGEMARRCHRLGC